MRLGTDLTASAMVLDAGHASADRWTMVYGSSPERLRLARTLAPRLATLRSKPAVSGTLRFQLPSSAVGEGRLNVLISNEAWDVPLNISLAIIGSDGSAVESTTNSLTFGGRIKSMLPEGASVVSDPVWFSAPDGGPLVVSVYVPGGIAPNPAGGAGMTLAPNDQIQSARVFGAKHVFGRPFDTAVHAEDTSPPTAIVAIGDAITGGIRTAPSAFRDWTETLRSHLALRPRQQDKGRKLGYPWQPSPHRRNRESGTCPARSRHADGSRDRVSSDAGGLQGHRSLRYIRTCASPRCSRSDRTLPSDHCASACSRCEGCSRYPHPLSVSGCLPPSREMIRPAVNAWSGKPTE